jgi:hypothetical protein
MQSNRTAKAVDVKRMKALLEKPVDCFNVVIIRPQLTYMQAKI